MKHQAPRIVALMLSVLLAAAAPVRAGTITFADVMQAASAGRRGPWADLHLRTLQQQGGKTASGVLVTTAQKTDASATASGNAAGAPDGSTAGNTSTSLISQDPAQQPQGTVTTIDVGDISGTVCDCGEAPVSVFCAVVVATRPEAVLPPCCWRARRRRSAQGPRRPAAAACITSAKCMVPAFAGAAAASRTLSISATMRGA